MHVHVHVRASTTHPTTHTPTSPSLVAPEDRWAFLNLLAPDCAARPARQIVKLLTLATGDIELYLVQAGPAAVLPDGTPQGLLLRLERCPPSKYISASRGLSIAKTFRPIDRSSLASASPPRSPCGIGPPSSPPEVEEAAATAGASTDDEEEEEDMVVEEEELQQPAGSDGEGEPHADIRKVILHPLSPFKARPTPPPPLTCTHPHRAGAVASGSWEKTVVSGAASIPVPAPSPPLKELGALLAARPLPRASLAIFNKRPHQLLPKRKAKRAAVVVRAPRPLPLYKRQPSGFEWTRAPRPPKLPAPSPLPLLPPPPPSPPPLPLAPLPLPLLTEGGASAPMIPAGSPHGAEIGAGDQHLQQQQQQQQAPLMPGGSMGGWWQDGGMDTTPILDDDVLLALFVE